MKPLAFSLLVCYLCTAALWALLILPLVAQLLPSFLASSLCLFFFFCWKMKTSLFPPLFSFVFSFQPHFLSKSCWLAPQLFIPSLQTGLPSGLKNSIAHFVSLSASIYASPSFPSFFFSLAPPLIFSLTDNRVSGPVYWNFPFALLASQRLITVGDLSCL